MILSVESDTKLPSPPCSNSQSPSPVSQVNSRSPPISYATFPISNPRQVEPHTGPRSDISALLGRQHPGFLSDDERPPSYEEIDASTRSHSRLWKRCAALGLVCVVAYSLWSSYHFVKGRQSIPGSPSLPLPEHPTTSILPPSRTSHSTSPPRSTSLDPPAAPEDPLPPPIEISFPYDPPFVPPDVGRTDLCRAWSYSRNDGDYVVSSEQPTIERLLYNLPAIAPISLETLTICSTTDGSKGPCNDYEGSTDSVPGKLHVVAADIQLPTVEILVQRSSELGIADISLCMMKRPLESEELSDGSQRFRWSFEIHIWKDPISPSWNSMLASLSIMITLPSAHAHDLTTRLDFFTQFIGPIKEPTSNRLAFGNLQLAGDFGRIEVRNANAKTINGNSYDSPLLVVDSRVSSSLVLKSTYGIIESNVTLVQTKDSSPVWVDLESTVGVVDTIVDLEYPLSGVSSPQFEIKAWSRYSRALIYMTDHRGTQALQSNLPPAVLPTIRMNLTSELAIAQALLPATFAGSIDMRSQHAEIGTIDRAKDLTGRTTEWYSRDPGSIKGDVRWSGAGQTPKGSLRVTTELAAARLLFFGFDDSLVETWPKELTEWRTDRIVSRAR